MSILYGHLLWPLENVFRMRLKGEEVEKERVEISLFCTKVESEEKTKGTGFN